MANSLLGAYRTFSLATLAGISPLATIPLAMLILFVLGMGLHTAVFRRLARTSASPGDAESRSLIVGFGLMFIVQNAATLTWGGGLSGMPYLDRPISIGSTVIVANRLLIIACMAAVSLLLVFTLKRTLIGKAVRGMLEAPLGALLVGIDTAPSGLLRDGARSRRPCRALSASSASFLPTWGTRLRSRGDHPRWSRQSGRPDRRRPARLIESFGMYLGSPSMKPLLSGVFVLIVLKGPGTLLEMNPRSIALAVVAAVAARAPVADVVVRAVARAACLMYVRPRRELDDLFRADALPVLTTSSFFGRRLLLRLVYRHLAVVARDGRWAVTATAFAALLGLVVLTPGRVFRGDLSVKRIGQARADHVREGICGFSRTNCHSTCQ